MSDPILDYRPASAVQDGRAHWPGAGFLLGIFAAVPALFLAMISAGAGHGHYEMARILFPLEMLATLVTGDTITWPLIIAACAQFPVYGAIIGWSLTRRKRWWATAGMFVVHCIAVYACFTNVLRNFS